MMVFVGRALAAVVFLGIALTYAYPLFRLQFSTEEVVMRVAMALYAVVITLRMLAPRESAPRYAPAGDRLLACALIGVPMAIGIPWYWPRIFSGVFDWSGFQIKMVTPLGAWVATAGALGASYCVLAMGKSYGLVPARRTIVRTGPYRIVRHPIFTCYVILMTGYVLVWYSIWTAAMAGATVLALVARSFLEELALREGDTAYEEYCKQVPYRFVPWVL